jgi:hypothetical protein
LFQAPHPFDNPNEFWINGLARPKPSGRGAPLKTENDPAGSAVREDVFGKANGPTFR